MNTRQRIGNARKICKDALDMCMCTAFNFLAHQCFANIFENRRCMQAESGNCICEIHQCTNSATIKYLVRISTREYITLEGSGLVETKLGISVDKDFSKIDWIKILLKISKVFDFFFQFWLRMLKDPSNGCYILLALSYGCL